MTSAKSISGCERIGLSGLIVLLMSLGIILPAGADTDATAPLLVDRLELLVTAADDEGEGSLRLALQTAAGQPDQPVRISFGDQQGLFATPQVIELTSPLPVIAGDVLIDGFIRNLLWKSYGVTVSGADAHRIFEVEPGARLHLSGVTLRHGRHEEQGGAILNHGRLLVEGVSLMENRAGMRGGAIANFGNARLINSTLAENHAQAGGAIAHIEGDLRLTNVTLHQNRAAEGAALWSQAPLYMANSILSGDAVKQCLNSGELDEESTHNLIQGGHQGCGRPLLEQDPQLQAAGYYNGPTVVLPIGGDSPVINIGLNEAAVDASGNRLVWDQRGNGDPRFAAGFTDLGAFERQGRLPDSFVVDTVDDNGLRACTIYGRPSCPLRAALQLAAAARKPVPVRFNPRVFDQPRTIVLDELPAGTDSAIVIDGHDANTVTIMVPTPVLWKPINGVRIEVAEADTHRQ